MDYQYIGNQIRLCRNRAGLTQERLAEASDLSASYISHVERGSKKISLVSLLRIAEALGVSIDVLIGQAGPDAAADFPEVNALLSECTSEEREIIFEVAKTLKRCLQRPPHS